MDHTHVNVKMVTLEMDKTAEVRAHLNGFVDLIILGIPLHGIETQLPNVIM